MTFVELLQQLRAAGVQVVADGDRIRVVAPKDVLTTELRAAIAAHKPDLLRYLAAENDAVADLEPVVHTSRTPLSPGQERVWAIVSRAPDSRRYNLPLAFRVCGALDVLALQRAVETIVARHNVLRSVIRCDESDVWTEVLDHGVQEFFQLHEAPANVHLNWIHDRVESEANRLFDLSAGPLLHVALVTLGHDDHLLMITMHHIAADGWSFEIFLSELAFTYDAARAEQSIHLPPMVLQYADVAVWQRGRLTPARRQQCERFWKDHFSGTPRPLALFPARSNATDQRIKTQIPSEDIARSESLGAAEDTSPFVVCLAAYAAYVAATTGSDEAILCTPAVGRDRDDLQGIIGYINNVLPLRLKVTRNATFRELVRAARRTMLSALEMQDLPFQDIATLPETQRVPLTRGMFSYSGRQMQSLQLGDCSVEILPVPDRTSDFDLALSIEAGEATLASRADVLGPIEPSAFLARFVDFLGRACTHPDSTLADLLSRAAVPTLPGRKTRAPSRARMEGPEPDDGQMVLGLPRDPLELQLALIWERILDTRPIAPDDNFFDLGGHSLLAVQLLNTIEREMGSRMDLSVLVRHPTVRSLARALLSGGWRPDPGSLIELQRGEPGPPFVLLHSFEGHLFLFNELAVRLSHHHPVFGLQAVGLDGAAHPHESVEQMAEHYLALLDERFGDAPIVLAAMCFGVSVGLEMAQRRTAVGKPTHLMLIDSSWEHLIRGSQDGAPRGIALRARERALREMTRLRWRVRESIRMVTGTPYARREARIRRRTARAWLDYMPRQYAGRLTLLRTKGNDPGTTDWKVETVETLARGDFQTIYVPGEHVTLLREPHVAGLAAAMVSAANQSDVAR